ERDGVGEVAARPGRVAQAGQRHSHAMAAAQPGARTERLVEFATIRVAELDVGVADVDERPGRAGVVADGPVPLDRLPTVVGRLAVSTLVRGDVGQPDIRQAGAAVIADLASERE